MYIQMKYNSFISYSIAWQRRLMGPLFHLHQRWSMALKLTYTNSRRGSTQMWPHDVDYSLFNLAIITNLLIDICIYVTAISIELSDQWWVRLGWMLCNQSKNYKQHFTRQITYGELIDDSCVDKHIKPLSVCAQGISFWDGLWKRCLISKVI